METRVHMLAKELGVMSKAVLEKARAEGIELKNHMTLLSPEIEARIRRWAADGGIQRRSPGAASAVKAGPTASPAGRPPDLRVQRGAGTAVVGGIVPKIGAGDVATQHARSPELDQNMSVHKGLITLAAGLRPFVETQMVNAHGENWVKVANKLLQGRRPVRASKNKTELLRDPKTLLDIIWQSWASPFGNVLTRRDRSLVSELLEDRNKSAHHEPFSPLDAFRTLHSIQMLLTSASASKEAETVDQMRRELVPLLCRAG